MWVKLNGEGMRIWGDVFLDGKVPVRSMSFHKATLGSSASAEEVILISWTALSAKQQDSIVAKVSSRLGGSKEEILLAIKQAGLPLRKNLTTGYVAAELRFFI